MSHETGLCFYEVHCSPLSVAVATAGQSYLYFTPYNLLWHLSSLILNYKSSGPSIQPVSQKWDVDIWIWAPFPLLITPIFVLLWYVSALQKNRVKYTNLN